MYPVSYEADFNPEPNRVTTFFRIIVAIPWIIVAYFWGILFLFTHLFAWVAIVVLGRYPLWLYEFNSGVVRFGMRTYAWIYLQTDAWPPFGLGDDPGYPIRLNVPPPAAAQSRLKAFFRLLLAFPVVLVVSYGSRFVLAGLGFVAWLTIVFRGYLPRWVFDAMSGVNSFDARVLGYVALLTDDYPPIGEERAKGNGELTGPTPPTPTVPPTATI